MARIPATEFKAKCLDLMDRVAERRDTYVITKRGKPVAKLVPADPPRKRSLFGCMADQTETVGDGEKALWTEEAWREFARQRSEQWKAWDREWRKHGTISRRRTLGRPPGLAKRKSGCGRTRSGAKR
jgi:prevent-host-death family protein